MEDKKVPPALYLPDGPAAIAVIIVYNKGKDDESTSVVGPFPTEGDADVFVQLHYTVEHDEHTEIEYTVSEFWPVKMRQSAAA
jgi:hypothetical protein